MLRQVLPVHWLLLAGLAFALSGCSGGGSEPFFEVHPESPSSSRSTSAYNFRPPTSSEGQTCVAECQQARSQCYAWENTKATSCERSNAGGLSNCNSALGSCSPRPSARNCAPANLGKCDVGYRDCYAACGGTVGIGPLPPEPARASTQASGTGAGSAAASGTSGGDIIASAGNASIGVATAGAVAPPKPANLKYGQQIQVYSVAPGRGPDIKTVSVSYQDGTDALTVINEDNPKGWRTLTFDLDSFVASQGLEALDMAALQYATGSDMDDEIGILVLKGTDSAGALGLLQMPGASVAPMAAIMGDPKAAGHIGLKGPFSGAFLGWKGQGGRNVDPVYGKVQAQLDVKPPQGTAVVTLMPPSDVPDLFGAGVTSIEFTANVDADSNIVWGHQVLASPNGTGEDVNSPFDTAYLTGGLYGEQGPLTFILRLEGKAQNFVALISLEKAADKLAAAQ